MAVHIHHNYTAYPTPLQNNLIYLAEHLLKEEEQISGTINVVFTDNEEILSLNTRYLNHNYYTDVIAFHYNKTDTVEGDVFISLDKVYENSIEYSAPFSEELLRVMIHGILHLIGYNDKNDEERNHMHYLEDRYLEAYYLNFR